jgi:putative inorganic carbon (HCO3(-)) transporter
MKLLNFCNKVIEYSFYLLFFLVPLAFTNDTSELFEFNKLWVTFIISIVIATAWITKMVIKKQIRIQRTPLDIPIVLFLISEVISSVISLDPHTSIWGYYSRFNGGLFSILAYVFLFYAFVSNLKEEEKEKTEKPSFDFKKIYIFVAGIIVFFIGVLISSQIKNADGTGIPYQMFANLTTVFVAFTVLMYAAPKGIIHKSLYAILSSSLLVVLWGLPSHFGYDPTCLLFRGTLDVSCWTSNFQPKVRIFSTLGQPDWMAAYLAVLLPIIAALILNLTSGGKMVFNKTFSFLKNHNFLMAAALFIFFVMSYLALIYTQARAAFVAIWVVIPALLVWYCWFQLKPKFEKKKLSLDFKVAVLILLVIGITTFIVGQPFARFNAFTLEGVITKLTTKPVTAKTAPAPAPTAAELGGTDSGTIRLLVWDGAINIWKNNPIFGSGLETFAYAYYQYRPAAHNMTSEWKFLYNKAHNEFLNYLATTGIVGIATYLLMIGSFLFFSARYLFKKRNKFSEKDFLIVSMIAGYGTILVTNFFGFSVVMINILFYLFPAFILILAGLINYDKQILISFSKKEIYGLNKIQMALIVIAVLTALYSLYTLASFWNADRNYYYGKSYDTAQAYEKAYPFLKEAIAERPSEPTFKDEFAYNNAVLGAALIVQAQKQTQNQAQSQAIAKQLIDNGIALTNQVTTEHPNDIVFWKTRVRIYYTLGQLNPTYLTMALEAIKKSAQLAPTDADVSYNLGVLYGQTGDSKDAVTTLENAIKLKPDYGSPYYALGIFYHQLAVDTKGKVVNATYNQKAIDTMNLMIKRFGPNQQASDAIKAWTVNH